MRSWDFFDTLLGRACGEPWRVFELIGGDEFKALRQQAEQQSDFTFEGIYASLERLTGWPRARIDDLRQQEYALEKKLAFPIVGNVNRVQPDDLVVTDTYFNAAQIRELADLIQLPEVEIVASYGGKHSGRVWKQFRQAKRAIAVHTGDNQRADFEMPRAAGFPAEHYQDGAFLRLDQPLIAAGHWDVAGLSRCVRLQNPYPLDDRRYQIWQKQASFNVPYLLLCAALLRKTTKARGVKKLLFLSRDTCLLQRVFNALYPDMPTETFYASRQLYMHPTPSFIEYARRTAAQPGVLFIDLQGTGKSVREFERATKLSLPYLYCTAPHNCPAEVEYLYLGRNTGTELEVLNYDVQGRVIDVRDGQPVRDAIEYDAQLVQASHDAVDCLLRHLYRVPSAPELSTLTTVLHQIRVNAPKDLVRQHQIFHPVVRPGSQRG